MPGFRDLTPTMSIDQRPDGSLVIEESFWFLRTGCIASGGLAVLIGVWLWSAAPDILMETKGIGWAPVVVCVFCAVGLIVDDRRFFFDRSHGVVTWQQRNVFRSRSGEIPFSDILDVVVTTERTREDGSPVGGYTIRNSLALVTSNGSIPLTSTFSRDRREYEKAAEAVLGVLASSPWRQ